MFRARLPSIFSTSHKMPRLPRNLHLSPLDAALPMRFVKNTQHDASKVLRLAREMTMDTSKVLRLPRETQKLPLLENLPEARPCSNRADGCEWLRTVGQREPLLRIRERKGKEGNGRDRKGKEGKGMERTGKERKERERKGKKGKGRERKGKEGKGRERKGRKGKERRG